MSLPKLFRLPLRRRPRIFISYRRDDSDTDADFLSEHLVRHFGKQQIFVDKDAIPIGKDFIETVESAVASCDALLAIIGKQWLVASDGQERRLEDPDDVVRFEITTALRRDILVIPVLVRGARMPRAEELPDELKSLARRHAFEISRAHRREDVGRLIVEIKKALAGQRAVSVRQPPAPAAVKPPPARSTRKSSQLNTRLAVVLSAVTLLIIMFGSVWLLTRSRAPNIDGADVPQPLGTPLSPSPTLSSSPEQRQEETLTPSPVDTQQPILIGRDNTRIKSPQSTPSPTPSPQVATRPREAEGPNKKGNNGSNEPLQDKSTSQTSPTSGQSIIMPSESEGQTGIQFGAEEFPYSPGNNQPIFTGLPTPTPTPLFNLPTRPTPNLELSPQEKYDRWHDINERRKSQGRPPLPAPTPFRPRPK